LDEGDMADCTKNKHFQKVSETAGNAPVIGLCAQIEAELAAIDNAYERKELMQSYGLERSGLDKLIQESYRMLGLVSYLTAGEPEVHAWTIRQGTRAPGAAGKIHTDFERGFIRAEVCSYDDFVASGGITKAKEAGRVRSEGKDYIVRDGDIIHFKFNV